MEQNNNGGSLSKFFQKDLKAIFKSLFTKPSSCVENLVRDADGASFATPLWMLLLTFLVTMLVSWLSLIKSGLIGWMESGDIFGACFKSGLMPLIFIAILTVLQFVAMAIKGCSDFKLAFFNITPHMMVFCMMLVLMTLIMMTMGSKGDPNTFVIILVIAIMLYSFTWGIGNIRQSLMAISGDDTYAWWMAPLVFGLSIALTVLIIKGIIGSQLDMRLF
jgi:hypothetical protein